jgi:tRNA pseudouridine38-40 synthase
LTAVRLRIDLAYDGSAFHGWARQQGLRTVQEEVERALDTVLRVTGTSLTVAGRTDAGVHARGQVAHVDVAPEAVVAAAGRRRELPEDALAWRLNGVLDGDVRIHRVVKVPEVFDARFSALWRRYAYRVADRLESVDPLTRGHVLAWPRALDEEAMNAAAGFFIGEHDFAAFCRKRVGATTVRALHELRWQRDDGLLVARVRADAFCHNMVRALVGCMLSVGEGRHEPEWAAQVLRAGVRDPAVKVAQARGLTLEEVAYPADEDLAERVLASRRVRGPL